MSKPDFACEIEIEVELETLRAFLCDLQNYVELHPLIDSIEELDPIASMPNARRFRVVDRIPFGPFKLRTVYTAALDPVAEDEVHGHAWQSPSVRLHTVYSLEPLERGTRVVESVRIEAPRLLRRFVTRQARDAHEQTLERMKSLLEDPR